VAQTNVVNLEAVLPMYNDPLVEVICSKSNAWCLFDCMLSVARAGAELSWVAKSRTSSTGIRDP
jgi:hypothetical protein